MASEPQDVVEDLLIWPLLLRVWEVNPAHAQVIVFAKPDADRDGARVGHLTVSREDLALLRVAAAEARCAPLVAFAEQFAQGSDPVLAYHARNALAAYREGQGQGDG